jgi:hypothetical protein
VLIMDLLTPSARPPGDERMSDFDLVPEPSRAARARVYLTIAVGPLITGYAVVAALLAMIIVTADEARFSTAGVLLAAGPGWLAAYQVPIEFGGHPLGMLPLLPTLGAGLLIARTAAGAALRLGCREPRQSVGVIVVLALAHAVFGLAIAMAANGVALKVEPVTAFLVPGIFAALAAAVGLASRSGLVSAARDYLDPLALRGVRAGALGMAGLLAAGALVCVLSLALSARTVADLFEPGIGNDLGLLLLSLGYLPNAIVAGLSFATGPGFSIGSVTVGPLTYSGGSVPGVPLLAGIPAHHAVWWPVLVLLPAATGVLVGWSVRKVDDDPVARLRTVGVAGALVGFGCVVLGTVAGGRLGDGPFDPVSIPVGVASVVAFCWIVIPGGLITFFAGAHEPPLPPGEKMFDDEYDEVAEETAWDEDLAELEGVDREDADPEGTDQDSELEDSEPDDVEPDDSEPDDSELEDVEPADGEAPEEPEEHVVPEAEEDGESGSENGAVEREREPDLDVTESTVESGGESEPEPDR